MLQWVKLGDVSRQYLEGMSTTDYQRLGRLIRAHGTEVKVQLDMSGDADHDMPALTVALRNAENCPGKYLKSGW